MRSGGLGVALAVTATLLAGPAPAHAQNQSDRKQDLERQLSALREDLEGTNQALVNAAVALRTAQSELVDARAGLRAAQAALAEAEQRDRSVGTKLAVAKAAVSKAQRQLAAREDLERATRGRLGSIAREAYASSGLAGLSIALEAQSPAQFADRVNVAGTALREQNGAIARLEVQQAEIRGRRTRLQAAQAQVAQLKRESERVVRRRDAAAEVAQAASDTVEGLVAVRQRSVATIAARKAAERRRLDALTREQHKLAALLRRRAPKSGAGFHNGSGRLSYPVQAPITSGFGLRYHPILHYWRLHAGVDFGAPCGTAVHAAAPGSVVRAGWAGGFGNQVVIEHGRMKGKAVASSYNHLSRIIVRGGHVARGQVIGYSGTTGLSTGCHLHFEVYVNGTHVNPMGWL